MVSAQFDQARCKARIRARLRHPKHEAQSAAQRGWEQVPGLGGGRPWVDIQRGLKHLAARAAKVRDHVAPSQCREQCAEGPGRSRARVVCCESYACAATDPDGDARSNELRLRIEAVQMHRADQAIYRGDPFATGGWASEQVAASPDRSWAPLNPCSAIRLSIFTRPSLQ